MEGGVSEGRLLDSASEHKREEESASDTEGNERDHIHNDLNDNAEEHSRLRVEREHREDLEAVDHVEESQDY